MFETLKKDILRKEFLSLVVLKLIMFPLFAFGFGLLLGLEGIAFNVTVLMAAMPIGILDFVLANKFHTEGKFMADAVVATTLISFVTISLVLGLLI